MREEAERKTGEESLRSNKLPVKINSIPVRTQFGNDLWFVRGPRCRGKLNF